MANDFEQVMPSYRLVQTQYGDDLQEVARRELNDQNRWAELLWLNGLKYPYLTDDPSAVVDGVLLNGSLIRVPAPAGIYSDKEDYDQLFERDVLMVNRRLKAVNGDLAVCSGLDNLSQQLNHRIRTPTGQVHRHPEYGCKINSLHGVVTGPTKTTLGAGYVKASLKADYRVATVNSVQAVQNGDAMSVSADLTPIAGAAIDLDIPLN